MQTYAHRVCVSVAQAPTSTHFHRHRLAERAHAHTCTRMHILRHLRMHTHTATLHRQVRRWCPGHLHVHSRVHMQAHVHTHVCICAGKLCRVFVHMFSYTGMLRPAHLRTHMHVHLSQIHTDVLEYGALVVMFNPVGSESFLPRNGWPGHEDCW